MNNTLLLLSSDDATGYAPGNNPNNPSDFVLPVAINIRDEFDCYIELQKFNSFNLLSNISTNLQNNILKVVNYFYDNIKKELKSIITTIEIPTNYYSINDLLTFLNTNVQATMEVSPQYSFITPGTAFQNTVFLGFYGTDLFTLNDDNCIQFTIPSLLGSTTINEPGYTYQKTFSAIDAVDEWEYRGLFFVCDDTTINLLDLLGITYIKAPSIPDHLNGYGFSFFGNTIAPLTGGTISQVTSSVANVIPDNPIYSFSLIHPNKVTTPVGYSKTTIVYNATYTYNLQSYTALLCCVDIPVTTLTSNEETNGFNVLGIIDLNANYGDTINYEEYIPTPLKITPLQSLTQIRITFRTLAGDIMSFEGIPWTLSLKISTKLSSQATLNQTAGIQAGQTQLPFFKSNFVPQRDQIQSVKRSRNDIHPSFSGNVGV
jgi:hypothetical protein